MGLPTERPAWEGSREEGNVFLVPNKMTRGKGQRQNPLDTETSSRGRGHPLPHCPLSALECSVHCPHPRHVPAPRLCDSQLTRSGTVGRGPDHPKPAPQCVSQRHTYFCPLVRPQVPGTLTWRTHTQNNRSWGSRISFRWQSVTCAEGDSLQVRPTCVHPGPSPSQSPALPLAGVSSSGPFLRLGNGNGDSLREERPENEDGKLQAHATHAICVGCFTLSQMNTAPPQSPSLDAAVLMSPRH